jgi:hypothetical protein
MEAASAQEACFWCSNEDFPCTDSEEMITESQYQDSQIQTPSF